MKKAIYLLAATALMASCNQDVLVEKPQSKPEAPHHIGFETFVDKATRADANNSNALDFFYPTFNVYGWKTVGSEVTCVFDNIPVSYYDANDANATKPDAEWGSTPETGWYYKYIRYWDKMASTYQFSAYAPAGASRYVTCTNDGLITIGTEKEPIKIEETNLMAKPSKELAYTGFKYDYMTAQSTANNNNNKVSLNFSHLQAKLNIRIKLDASIITAQDVSVQKIQIHNLGRYGYYSNKNTESVTGWTLAKQTDLFNPYVPSVEKAYSLNGKEKFDGYSVLEQLIIPQTIAKYTGTDLSSLKPYSVACVYVEYTIGTEVFKSFTPLANIFSNEATYNFEGGKQYTLNIIIGPKPIEFTAEVSEWETEINGKLPMD